MKLFVLLVVLASVAIAQKPPYPDSRVPPSLRKFNSTAVEAIIADMVPRLADPNVARMFNNCFPNTLDTTVDLHEVNNGVPDTFIITGDIDAMWLRDSTNQVAPYLPYVTTDPALDALVCGVVHRQASYVLFDPYANAFNDGPGEGWHDDDRIPEMQEELHEGKYELDSLAAFIRISNQYFASSGSLSCFDATWVDAVALAMSTTRLMQAGTEEDYDDPNYKFNRLTQVATDTLMMQGRGPPAKRCGLSKCAFRPSDDATTLPYLIPANAMMAVELEKVVEILAALGETALAQEAEQLGSELRAAVMQHGVVQHPIHGEIFAYEVDCYSSFYIMDDANIPGLLSLPYLGFISKEDPLYLRTRAVLLSDWNPFYFAGTAASGIGGPHAGFNYVWPMAVAMQALTSTSDAEIAECLRVLSTTTDDLFFMHEGVHKNDPSKFTRSWFAWANSLFGELILTLAEERPHLIF